ncbi:MAG TPA: UDP-glucose 4-epimerase GalE [Burkholderiaceae bacterium]|nr:UDP-glucose 4-epimerase GalE [Burkholderiaceae bacterium]
MSTRTHVLVTGGAGYIGSHTIVELLGSGFDVVCLDNFCNGSDEALKRVERISGRAVQLVEGDVRDAGGLQRAFEAAPISAVVHFAGLKAVADSVQRPLEYYDNNVSGSVQLLRACQRFGVRRFIFSSSATVYGVPQALPYTEDMALAPINPYGATKAAVEQMLRDVCGSDREMCAVCLRYFKPIGAHPSGLIGEDPRGTPNNIFPIVLQVAAGRRDHLSVFGNDWPTVDGTGVRDYLHVVDLAAGHVRALQYTADHPGFIAINLGTGSGTSVLELVRNFELATGQRLACRIEARRPGDLPQYWASVDLAQKTLRWRARRTVQDMCSDGWRWQQANPRGYDVNRDAGKVTQVDGAPACGVKTLSR